MDIKKGPVVRVVVDEEGRPYCPQGCGHLMTETAPGQFQCPDWVAIQTAMKESLGQLITAASGNLDQLVEVAFGTAPDPAGQTNLIDDAQARRPGYFAPLGALTLPRSKDGAHTPFGLLPIEADLSVPPNEIQFRTADQLAILRLDEGTASD